MRLKNVPGAREAIAASDLVIKDVESLKGKWREFWGNDKEIHIEVGMGKGKFIMELAEKNPDVNYVGIERYSSVLLRGLQKRAEMDVSNIYFMRIDALELAEVFDAEEVDRIYLNFSDPWPKDRHAKRRLTSKEFFARSDQILKSEGRVEFKTDNRDLFDFSVESVKEAKWNLDTVTYDLHHDEELVKGNVMTEYEEKFSAMGNPIHKLMASR